MKALLDRRFLPADGEFGLFLFCFVSFEQEISTRKVVLKLLKLVGFLLFLFLFLRQN